MNQAYQELEQISAENPTGVDVRLEPVYDELQAEIDKMSLPSSSGGVNWARVKSLAHEVLTSKSKDMLVASYYVVAKAKTEKQEGLADGLHIYAGLLETYWDGLFPAKKRIRGRMAAVSWLLDKCESAFDERELAQVTPEVKEKFEAGLNRLDSSLETYFDSYSQPDKIRSSYKLKWIIDKSVVAGGPEVPVQEEQRENDLAVSENDKNDEGGNDTSIRVKETTETAVQEEKQMSSPPTDVKDDSSLMAKDQKPLPTEETVAIPPKKSQTDGAGIEKNLRTALLAVKHAGNFYFSENLYNQFSYRLRRIAIWTMITDVPEAVDGQTQILPPGEFKEIKQRLVVLYNEEKGQELLTVSENRLDTAVLWLDLNRYTAESLAKLGSNYQNAYDAVCRETAALISRLPGLETLNYSDGSPFANNETRKWLEEMMGEIQSSGQAMELLQAAIDDDSAQVIENAQQLMTRKKVAEAVELLSERLKNSVSGREAMTWRMSLAQLLLKARLVKLAIPHLEELLKAIDSYSLEDWDPVFTIQALKVVCSGYRQDKSTREQGEIVFSRIARLDPLAALQMEKR